jgi:hypothetical protein
VTGERIAGIAAFAVVVGGVAIGFAAIGPPQHVRLVEADQRRVADLLEIESLLHLDSGQRPSSSPVPDRPAASWPRDPVTRKPYEYHRDSAARYRLCAVFALASGDENVDSGWRHGAGRTCYRLSSVGSGRPTD